MRRRHFPEGSPTGRGRGRVRVTFCPGAEDGGMAGSRSNLYDGSDHCCLGSWQDLPWISLSRTHDLVETAAVKCMIARGIKSEMGITLADWCVGHRFAARQRSEWAMRSIKDVSRGYVSLSIHGPPTHQNEYPTNSSRVYSLVSGEI